MRDRRGLFALFIFCGLHQDIEASFACLVFQLLAVGFDAAFASLLQYWFLLFFMLDLLLFDVRWHHLNDRRHHLNSRFSQRNIRDGLFNILIRPYNSDRWLNPRNFFIQPPRVIWFPEHCVHSIVQRPLRLPLTLPLTLNKLGLRQRNVLLAHVYLRHLFLNCLDERLSNRLPFILADVVTLRRSLPRSLVISFSCLPLRLIIILVSWPFCQATAPLQSSKLQTRTSMSLDQLTHD